MKRTSLVIMLALGLSALVGPGCLEDKVLDIVLTGETFADFAQDEANATFTTPVTVDMGQEIRNILDDNGYSVGDLKDAFMTSAFYGVVSFNQSHDWEITGRIDVTYGTTTATAITYTAQSVQGALGKKISVPLEQGGVDLINQALDDFRAGQNRKLTFTVVNGSVSPAPSSVDRMVFTWRAWIDIQVILDEKVTVPDPF
jgi:hypothetical protein